MTPAQLASIRAYVGDSPSDEVLDTLWLTHESVEGVAHEVLVGRLREMQEGDPLRFTVDGDVTEDYTENVRLLERTVKQLAGRLPSSSGMTHARMTRHRPR